MGYRTTVILFNDRADEWEKDPLLGKKIARAMNYAGRGHDQEKADLDNYGRVVECAHADTQTLAVLDSYNFEAIAHTGWRPNQNDDEVKLELLRQAASKLGYNLTKQPAKA